MLSSKNKGVVGEVGSALAGQINDLPDKCGRSDPIESEGVSFAAPTFFGPAAAALDEIERLSAENKDHLFAIACMREQMVVDRAEIARVKGERDEAVRLLRPFSNTAITPAGEVIGMERHWFDAARSFLSRMEGRENE